DIQSPISSSGGEGTLDDDAHLRRKAMNRAESYRSHTPGSGTDRGSKKRRSAARLVPAALTLLAATLSGCASGSDEVADNPEDFFEGKTITWIVPHTAGGGTDSMARQLAPLLTKYLPGNPDVVIENISELGGMAGMNEFVERD